MHTEMTGQRKYAKIVKCNMEKFWYNEKKNIMAVAVLKTLKSSHSEYKDIP